MYVYRPVAASDPPPLYNPNGDQVFGYYRWTRAGLKGVDFGGAEQWKY
jgi:hypothetical protein